MKAGGKRVPVLSNPPGTRRYPEMWFLLSVLVLVKQHNLEGYFWCSKWKDMDNLLFVSEDSCSLYDYSMSKH